MTCLLKYLCFFSHKQNQAFKNKYFNMSCFHNRFNKKRSCKRTWVMSGRSMFQISHIKPLLFLPRLPPSLYFLTYHRSHHRSRRTKMFAQIIDPITRQIITLCSSLSLSVFPMTTLFTHPHTHTHIHSCTYKLIHTHSHINTHTHTNAFIRSLNHVNTHTLHEIKPTNKILCLKANNT